MFLGEITQVLKVTTYKCELTKKERKKQTKTIKFKVSVMQYIQQYQNLSIKDLFPHTNDQNLVTRNKMQYREQMTEAITRKHQPYKSMPSTAQAVEYFIDLLIKNRLTIKIA